MSDLEIVVSDQAGFADASGKIGQKAKEAFDHLGTVLSEAIEPFRRKLTDAAVSADEVELQLDLAFKGGGQWVVISMESSATVSVKLVWKRQS